MDPIEWKVIDIKQRIVDMKKQLKVGVWKEIFVEMAEEASIDYNNIKNKKRVHSFSLLPRFDHYVRNFIETCNKSKKT